MQSRKNLPNPHFVDCVPAGRYHDWAERSQNGLHCRVCGMQAVLEGADDDLDDPEVEDHAHIWVPDLEIGFGGVECGFCMASGWIVASREQVCCSCGTPIDLVQTSTSMLCARCSKQGGAVEQTSAREEEAGRGSKDEFICDACGAGIPDGKPRYDIAIERSTCDGAVVTVAYSDWWFIFCERCCVCVDEAKELLEAALVFPPRSARGLR